jgi:multisubunit Na+/H+ antiporter MnhE subunit
MPPKRERQAAKLGSALARWLGWWVALGALWLALDDTVALPELATGAVAAAIGATAAELVHAQKLVRVRLRARWLRHAWRLPVALVVETAAVFAVLFRQLVLRKPPHSAFRAIRFRAEGPRSAFDTTRRALAKSAGSFAPNSYVVGVDADRDLLLVHQLAPRGDPDDLDPLELR